MTLLIMAICTVLFERVYKILRYKEPRRQLITNFSFKMFKIIRSLRSSKCSKTTVELPFTTQKANARSPWIACSVFNRKYLFWGKFGPKTQNYQFKLKVYTQTNSNVQNSMVMLTFSVFDGKSLFG